MATLLAILLSVIAFMQSLTSVDARLCINADDKINKFYIDGRNMRDHLPYRSNPDKCDCIEIPPFSGVIAVEAYNMRLTSGIQSCNTDNPTLYDNWRCMPAKLVTARNWYRPDFNDTDWKPARSFKCPRHCHNHYYHLPCGFASTKCYWSLKNIKTVRCRLKYCEKECSGCKSGGPGSCDPDKCDRGNGLATDPRTGKQHCAPDQCRLEVKAWGQQNETADGYMTVTDVQTNAVDTWSANTPGNYIATIDMTTCTITNRIYREWILNDQTISAILSEWVWNPSLANVIGVQLAVGPSDPPTDIAGGIFGPFAPYIAVWRLGLYDYAAAYSANDRGFSATLIGIQNGDVTFTDVVQTPFWSGSTDQCRLEVKAWGQENETADGYMTVTDVQTNAVDTWSANTPGQYLATIDMTTCTITKWIFREWIIDDTTITDTLNQWKASPYFINVIAVELAVGPSDPPTDVTAWIFNSFAPYIAVWSLGPDVIAPAYSGNDHVFSATLLGIQRGDVNVTDVVQTP